MDAALATVALVLAKVLVLVLVLDVGTSCFVHK